MSNKILVIGANGMLGYAVFRYFSCQHGFDVLGTVRSNASQRQLALLGFTNTVAQCRAGVDSSFKNVFENFKPDFVINCVGLVKQLPASEKAVQAVDVNALFPHRLAELSTACGARLIHFSTDCVFSGSKGMYVESDTPDAIDIYGRSKLLGEVYDAPHLTLRTSIIGHELNSNVSLIDWFLSRHGTLNGYSRAIFSGLPTICVAKFIHQFVLNNKDLHGLYHLAAEPISKYDLLSVVRDVYGKRIEIIPDDSLVIDRSLDSARLRQATGFIPRPWPDLVEAMHNFG